MGRIGKLIKHLLCFVNNSRPIRITVSQIAYDKMYTGKHVLVTGGTSGIGLEIAKKFLTLGAKVTITGRCIERLCAIEREIHDVNLSVIEWDISKADIVYDKVNETVERMGKIDVLINNAGIYVSNNFYDSDEQLFDDAININLKGLFFSSKAVSEYYIENRIEGKIINIGSIRGIQGAAEPYGISKWGVRGLTQGLARDLTRHGIIVNAIAPGITATGINDIRVDDNAFTGTALDNRVATPEEIAEIAVFLASNAANHIVGQTIVCDGGETLI